MLSSLFDYFASKYLELLENTFISITNMEGMTRLKEAQLTSDHCLSKIQDLASQTILVSRPRVRVIYC